MNLTNSRVELRTQTKPLPRLAAIEIDSERPLLIFLGDPENCAVTVIIDLCHSF
jgi:hypothetical protein